MNLQEFAALKPGDKIRNDMAHSDGEVIGLDDKGIHVRWVETGRVARDESVVREGTTRHYSVASTIWFHWSRVDDVSQSSAPSTSDAPAA